MIYKLYKRAYLIAEAGVNHNGSFVLAKKLIEKAALCKASAIKFQIFNADDLATKKARMANYQVKNLKKNISQHKMLKSLELKKEDYIKLKKIARQNKIDFLVSVFDEKSLDFFEKHIKSKIIKIPSGEITNYFLLKKINLKKYKVILSTGMSNLTEIKDALNVISKKEVFEIKNNNIFIKNKKKYLYIKDRIFLLHCVSDYPTKEKYLNLNCIKTLKDQFKLVIGFSDHTKGIEASKISLAVGAKIIEKHFTLNKKMYGPDHSSSLDPKELKILVDELKKTEILLGSKTKKSQPCEYLNMRSIRKSIVAKKNIRKNEKIYESMLTAKRPGTGISPMKLKNIINKPSKKNIKKNEMLK